MRVRARQTQSINNVASVLDNIVPDPNPANNEAAVEHEITDVADVGVTKSAVGEVTIAGCTAGDGADAERGNGGPADNLHDNGDECRAEHRRERAAPGPAAERDRGAVGGGERGAGIVRDGDAGQLR